MVLFCCGYIAVLTESTDPKDYWYRLKKREREGGVELSTNCRQLRLPSSDGKFYATDCANTKSLFRIIQSIPSKKAEPFKQWLAQLGKERIEEIENPELAQDRVKEYYELKGYEKIHEFSVQIKYSILSCIQKNG